jgi:hypothetical protein
MAGLSQDLGFGSCGCVVGWNVSMVYARRDERAVCSPWAADETRFALNTSGWAPAQTGKLAAKNHTLDGAKNKKKGGPRWYESQLL